MLLELAPQTCFGIEQDRRLVSTATLVCYGRRLAWIGMVLTHPEYRGRGFAHALEIHAVLQQPANATPIAVQPDEASGRYRFAPR